MKTQDIQTLYAHMIRELYGNAIAFAPSDINDDVMRHVDRILLEGEKCKDNFGDLFYELIHRPIDKHLENALGASLLRLAKRSRLARVAVHLVKGDVTDMARDLVGDYIKSIGRALGDAPCMTQTRAVWRSPLQIALLGMAF